MRGELCLVVDLQSCTGMDSTFMGTLAGLANRLTEKGGALHVADADDKSCHSLEDLGLNFLMQINPEQAVWIGLENKVRDLLKPKVAGMTAGTVLHTRHVLEAHEILSNANEDNRQKFSGVVELLADELTEKAKTSADAV